MTPLPVTNTLHVDSDPTPEFNERCMRIYNDWKRGDIPFQSAIDQLTALARETLLTNHLANQGRVEQLLGVIQGYAANYEAGIRHFERAHTLFEQLNNPRRAASMLLNLGESYRHKGDFTRARELFHTTYARAGALGSIPLQAHAACNEGVMLVSMEQVADAHVVLGNAYQLAQQITDDETTRLTLLAEARQGLALACLKMGNRTAALDFACEALAYAQEVNDPLMLGITARTMGEVLTGIQHQKGTLTTESAVGDGQLQLPCNPNESDDPDLYFRAAIEQLQTIKAEGEMARVMHAHALSLGLRGRDMTAARKLQQAMLIFIRLGMVHDAAKTAQAQFDLLTNR